MEDLTVKEVGYLDNINTETEKMSFGTRVQELIDGVNALNIITQESPVNATNKAVVLDISGVVIHGESVEIGTDIYEFAADAEQSVNVGSIPVDIEGSTVKAYVDLTVDVNPTLGNTFTLGTKVFTIVPLGTANANGEIDLEATLAATQANIVAAIKGTDLHNDPHPLVTAGLAFAMDVLRIEALIGGVAANTIPSTETFTAGTNVFSAVTLLNGVDCIAANAVTALVAAITASDTQGFGAADGAGDTVDITADVAGVIGNATVITEAMANGVLMGVAPGVDGTLGLVGEIRRDATWLYVCIANNTIAGKNWRRIALGTVY